MSQSGRSSSSKSSQSGGGASAPPQDTHKFSSIVNKVESLISKMHHDKVNNFKLLQQQQHQHGELDSGQSAETATKCASLDSLNNLTDADSCEEHELLYTDSDDAEIAHITGTTAAQVHHNQQQLQQLQLHRRSDLDQLTNESIRELNEQCCMSLGAELNAAGGASGAAGGGADTGGTEQDYDNAWSVEEDIVYKCCSGTASTITSASGSASGSLCEECCFEEQLSYKLRLNQRDNNNNSSQNQQDEEAMQDETGANATSAVTLPLPVCGTIAGLPGPSLGLLGGNKTRRVSNASSGSVSRMETILEEPTESKISVKEILARFETMNSNEVGTITIRWILGPNGMSGNEDPDIPARDEKNLMTVSRLYEVND